MQKQENPVLLEVQKRLPDKILAGGFFTQEDCQRELGTFVDRGRVHHRGNHHLFNNRQ